MCGFLRRRARPDVTYAEAMARRTFLSTWTVNVTIGEAIGSCAPALVGVWSTSRGIEGLHRAQWIVGTAIAASLTWFGIMSVRLAPDLGSAGIALAIVAGAAALMSIATVLWCQRRPHLARANQWLVWTPLAWAVAVQLSFLPGLLVTGIGMQRMLRVHNHVAIRQVARA